MFNEELLQFIRTERAAGMIDTELKHLLMTEGGWEKADIDEAYRVLDASVPALPVEPTTTQSTLAQKSFLGELLSQGSGTTSAGTAPLTSRASASFPSSTPPNIKKEGWSLEGLLNDAGTLPGSLSQPAPRAALSATPEASASPESVAMPIKFNLSSLHPEATPSLTPLETGTAPVALSAPSAMPKTALAHPPETFLKEQSEEVPTPPVDVSAQGESATVPISGKRTMLSDLLLHGGDATPAPVAPPEKSLAEINNTGEAGQSSMVVSLGASPFDDDAKHKNTVKRILIIVGAFLLLASIGGSMFIFVKFRAPEPNITLAAAFSQFFGVSSFAYKGQATTDLTLSAAAGDTPGSGMIRFSLGYAGALGNGAEGYGDGLHNITFTGGWQLLGSATTTFTNIVSEARIIGSALYYHTTLLPETTDLDPELFKANWVKVDFFEITKLLNVSGITSGAEGYGNFGGTNGEYALNTLLKKALPLQVTESPSTEMINGVAAMRMHVLALPDAMASLAQELYKKYANHELTLSADQMVRLKSAMAKISGDVWVDAQTGTLIKIVLLAKFDDDIMGAHVQGPVTLDFSFADFNKPVVVDIPSGVLTLADLYVKMDEYQQTKAQRARDDVKITRIAVLATALENYRLKQGRYPTELTELYGAGMLAASPFDLVTLKSYFYQGYQRDGVYTKSKQCLANGKVCAFYHLGVNLEDTTNNILKNDADLTTAILGSDATGCAGEVNMACYDVSSGMWSPTAQTGGATTTPAH